MKLSFDMITLFKQHGNVTSASHISLDELVEMIRGQKYGRELQTYREVWPLKKADRMDDDRYGKELGVKELQGVQGEENVRDPDDWM